MVIEREREKDLKLILIDQYRSYRTVEEKEREKERERFERFRYRNRNGREKEIKKMIDRNY